LEPLYIILFFLNRDIFSAIYKSNDDAKGMGQRAEGIGHGAVIKSTCDYRKIRNILLEEFFISGGVLVGVVAEKYR